MKTLKEINPGLPLSERDLSSVSGGIVPLAAYGGALATFLLADAWAHTDQIFKGFNARNILKTIRTWLDEVPFWGSICVFLGGLGLGDILNRVILYCFGLDLFALKVFVKVFSILLVVMLFAKLGVTSSTDKASKDSK